MQCLISGRRRRSRNASATCSGATSCTAGEVRPTRYAGTMLRPVRNSASASCLAIRSAPRSIAVRSSHLARACGCMRGDLAGAQRAIEEAAHIAAETCQPWGQSIALRVQSEIWLSSLPQQLDAAEAAVRAAIDIQVARECRCDLAWSRLVLGRVLQAKGNSAAGLAELVEAKREFEQLGIARGIENVSAAL